MSLVSAFKKAVDVIKQHDVPGNFAVDMTPEVFDRFVREIRLSQSDEMADEVVRDKKFLDIKIEVSEAPAS